MTEGDSTPAPLALEELIGLSHFLRTKLDEDPERVMFIIADRTAQALGVPPAVTDQREAVTLMDAAGVLIDAAGRLGHVDALQAGEAWMEEVVRSGTLEGDLAAPALYFLANARTEISNIHLRKAWSAAEPADRRLATVSAQLGQRTRLRSARREYSDAIDSGSSGRSLSMQLCNLGNALDHSGRWIEAYDAYARAVEADPTNGNASGNAAIAIRSAIRNGWDFEGHLCSLFDHYVRLAKRNRAGTVEVAGEAAARHWDELEELGSDEPIGQTADGDDPYRIWVIKHRLALVAALEGAGSSEYPGRWDTITLSSATTADEGVPTIYSLLNILKSDFLVARRLAYEAIALISRTGGWSQDDGDPGLYTDTIDYSIYGEATSKLVLAHRAALDVLDKTAVAVNEHMACGLSPQKIYFRTFWFADRQQSRLREQFTTSGDLAMAALPLAELALDMTKEGGGMYVHAQDVRNAGTHRFVVVHHGMRDIRNSESAQALKLAAMLKTCMQSLTVARAAYLYLVALLEVVERQRQGEAGDGIYLPLMTTP